MYITIDADGMDPTEMPAVMAPSPGGILYREIAPVLRRIARAHRVVGMDVVEVAPSYDSANGITAIMAGRLVMNVLGASWAPDGAMHSAKIGNAANSGREAQQRADFLKKITSRGSHLHPPAAPPGERASFRRRVRGNLSNLPSSL